MQKVKGIFAFSEKNINLNKKHGGYLKKKAKYVNIIIIKWKKRNGKVHDKNRRKTSAGIHGR